MDLLKDLENSISELEAEKEKYKTLSIKMEQDLEYCKDELDSYWEDFRKLKRENENLSKKLEELSSAWLTEEALEKLEKKIKEQESVINSFTKKPRKKRKKAWRSASWNDIIIEDNLYNKLQLSYDKKLPLLLKWPSGTGKSTFVRALAEEKGNSTVEFNFNGDTTVEHLLGHKILVNWDMIWEDWPLTDAVRNWKVFIWHELNSSNPEIQFILNGLLELDRDWNLGKLSVQGNNWEVIPAHKDFRFYGTYNPWYLWTKSFGASIMSRFIWAEVKPLWIEDEVRLLLQLYPKLVVEVNLLAELEAELRKNKNFQYDVSTRDIIQTLMFIDWWFSIEEAVEATIANSCQIELEIETLWEVLNNLLSKLKVWS